ncbi:thioredoxin domain-containing protein [Microbacterium sp. VKM Ac-2923]|uniref:DsbA family protein n=1 Tax=Microbacterium sp. VKM Ac-2923 TaxID=2929476 RepID=UPI001FB21275|nr:thioredoxin domain-containing protein [Microbacterium sp. VKM Ac-2923]MCJ1706606.1 DsbA family protein [Microbacterium sp. VKM Ac-2923]
MKTQPKPLLITLAALIVVVVIGLVAFLVTRAQAPDPAAAAVVGADSHVLDDAGDGAVTVVEFLDFECEACGAYYPVVEDVRQKYAGQITYVVRYFPLPGHFNSTTSAVAAEAAAQQGRFEDMYHRLFETQAEWGEAQESRADLFREYAVDLGLDMATYDAAVADPETEQRVRADFEEGRALGVRSTPTFFVDGRPLVIERWNDLETAIDAALDR